MNSVTSIRRKIVHHPQNAVMKEKGYQPIFTAHSDAKIVIIGQAPGIRAQESNKP